MLDTFEIYEELAKSFGDDSARVLTKTLTKVYEDVKNSVTKSEFNEVKIVVQQLAEAQNRTELKIEELVEIQKETNREVSRLDKALSELAEAQKRTEIRVEELAEAQRKAELRLNSLSIRMDKVEERLEGISNSVGYHLEDMAYKALPGLLKGYGIEVKDRIIRRYIGLNQVNIFTKATKEGKDIYVMGECKVRPSKKEIDKFLNIVKIIQKEYNYSDFFLIFVANDYHPNVEKYLKEKNIVYFWSYEF